MTSKIEEKIKEIKFMNLRGQIDWGIDYSELDYYLIDKDGRNIKPLLFVIAHPESYYILRSCVKQALIS